MRAPGARDRAMAALAALAVGATATPAGDTAARDTAPDDDAPSDAVAVMVLDGEAAVPGAVTDQPEACATGGVSRAGGTDRFATAAALSQAAHPEAPTR